MENLLAAEVPVTPIAFFAAILVFMVAFAVWSVRKTRDNLTRLARDLSLNLREKPAVLGLFRPPPTVDGELHGRKVRFFGFSTGSGKGRMGWSAVGVGCANPHHLKLQLCAQNFLTQLDEKSAMQDVRVGDQPFDDRFVVLTNAPEYLRTALVPEMREPLLVHWPAALAMTTLKIEGDEVVYAETGGFTDEDMLRRMSSLLDVLIALAALPEAYSG